MKAAAWCSAISAIPSSTICRSRDVVGDRMALTIVISLASVLFVWIVSFPIAVYSGDPSIFGLFDYVFTFLGYIGLATPSFLHRPGDALFCQYLVRHLDRRHD